MAPPPVITRCRQPSGPCGVAPRRAGANCGQRTGTSGQGRADRDERTGTTCDLKSTLKAGRGGTGPNWRARLRGPRPRSNRRWPTRAWRPASCSPATWRFTSSTGAGAKRTSLPTCFPSPCWSAPNCWSLRPKARPYCWALAHETCAREAAEKGRSLHEHASHLVIHGLLHLAGRDHEISPQDAEEMEALEVKALAQLGIADPYGDR